MTYSGPGTFDMLEEDLMISDDESEWPRLHDAGRKKPSLPKVGPQLVPPLTVDMNQAVSTSMCTSTTSCPGNSNSAVEL